MRTRATGAGSALFGRGLLYVFVSAAQMLSSVVVSPVLAHVLSDPGAFGRLASAIALHQLLVVVALVGLDQAVLLQRADDGHDRAAGSIASAGVLLVTFLSVLLVLTSRWWADPLGFSHPSMLLTATIVWTAPAAAVMVLLALLMAGDRLRLFSVVSLVAALGGQVCGLVLLLTLDGGESAYLWGLVVADVVAVAIGFSATRSAWARLPGPALLRQAFGLGLPLMLGSLSSFVLNAGDRVIIQKLAGSAEVGRYQVAYTVGFAAVQVVVLLGNAWLPRFAEMKDEDLRRRAIGSSRDHLYRLLAPVVLGMTLGAPVLLRIFAPPSFGREGLLVVVFLVVLAAYPVAASGASGRVLLIGRRVRAIAVITAATAVLNVVLNLLLVPWVGIAGAAAATALAFTAQALGQRFVARVGGVWPRTPPKLLAVAVAVVVVAGITTWLPQTDLLNAARFAAGLACLPWLWWEWRRARESTDAVHV